MYFSLEVRVSPELPAPSDHRRHQRRSVTMGRLLKAMSGIGMSCDSGAPPRFPLWTVYGVTGFDSLGAPEGARADRYQSELSSILSWHGDPELTGIPQHKLIPPQVGWHVTATECEQALAAYHGHIDAGGSHPWIFGTSFIPFLTVAAEHDGFEVH